jgi:hypothetical protein
LMTKGGLRYVITFSFESTKLSKINLGEHFLIS